MTQKPTAAGTDSTPIFVTYLSDVDGIIRFFSVEPPSAEPARTR